MALTADLLVLLVAALHIYFLVLEMFLWERPIGLKTFRNTPERARDTAVLAANQGLYNGFLAAGLGLALHQGIQGAGQGLALFCLACVVIAGVFGAATVSRRILYVQTAPAFAAAAAVLLGI